MHGCGVGSDVIVNAGIDSMGGFVEGGVGIGTITSPQTIAIEKVRAELRQECSGLHERKRQLEFLEEGGDPLNFKIVDAASLSVQSTSLTDKHPDQFVTSEIKGSFAITTSAHGDSVESSGRPAAPQLCEPNSADNLMLFDGENKFVGSDRGYRHPSRSNVTPSGQSSKFEESQNAKELGKSTAFGIPKKAYKRRYRPRPNRDSARSSSSDIARGGHDTSLPSQHFPKDVKGLVSDLDKDQNSSLNIAQTLSPNGGMALQTMPSDNQLDLEVDGVKAAESTTDFKKDDMLDTVPDASASRGLLDNQHNQNPLTCVQKVSVQQAPEKPQVPKVKGRVGSAGLDCQPDTTEREVENSSSLMNGFGSRKGCKKSFVNEAENSGVALGAKGLDSESSCTQTSLSLDGHNYSETCTNLNILDSNGNLNGQLVVPDGMAVIRSDVKVKNEIEADMNSDLKNENPNSGHGNHQSNGSVPKLPKQLVSTVSKLQSEIKDKLITEKMEEVGPSELETTRKCFVLKREDPNPQDVCNVGTQGMIDTCIPEHSECVSQTRVSNPAPEGQTPRIQGDEDSILKEAQIIEAKRKRIAELTAVTCPLENGRKSHWYYVLEEMVWLANDFAQERLWKITAAGQICHQVAFNSRLRFQERKRSWEQKMIAHNVAKSVMDFWHSVEVKSQKMELARSKKDYTNAIREYAIRFLKYNDSDVSKNQAEASLTPDRISDWGNMDTSLEDHLTEENLFYPVLLGAMDAYRKSIESHVQLCEKTGNCIQEEVESSACDAVTDCAYEVDEGETSAYDRSVALEGNKSSRFPQKARKILLKGYNGRPYDVGAGIQFTQCMENRVGSHQSVVLGKRPASTLNVSIPTKRVRTASRQRVVSPFGATTAGCVQLPIKTDASSGDTGSFQDDQSTLQGGSHMNSLEVESVGDYEKHLLFDSAEVSKPKKKKKAKLLGTSYGQRWQVDSNYQINQKDHSRKRFEGHQLESNGSSGLFGQHIAKKPKLLRQSFENSFENNTPIGGSIPSPVASQMSNMSNPNKLMRMLSGRDRNRKAKTLKMTAGQAGSGSPWSLFEEQALVVLVHDMGPNWELVSDAINSTLQFKCIYRKPNECKERHKVLMDRTTGDGADSAEDSGSSQPYPSTLPGIPKGSARQLFQRLQGPMEEDTLKSHFEKIILIGKKYLLRKTQGENYDLKQIQQPHDSHMHALSQLCPSNLNGGSFLTPLDLCEEPPRAPSSPDFLPAGFEGSYSGGLSMSSPGGGSVLPASGANSGVQAPTNMILGSNFPSSTSPLNASVRYAVPRAVSFPVDEQQRSQQYNPMLSGNMQSNKSAPGALAASDSGGARTHPSGNSMGALSGLNRGMAMARPGFQGIASSSMLSSGTTTMPSTVNMQSGVSSNQGNSMSRPRDVLHMIRPSPNQESQKQMILPELQIKVSQGSSQGVPPFGGSSTSFPNQTASSPVSSHPLHHQQPHLLSSQQPLVHSPRQPHLQGASHATSPQHQAYAIRLARERHLQQRLLQQQHKQLSHTQPHLPIPSSLQNSPQITSQTSSPPVSLSPLTSSSSISPMPQHQLKHPFPAHGLGRSAQTGGSSLITQMSKPRPHQIGQQQLQNVSRHHPPQRQQSESQKQAKFLKGVGRGKSMIQQNMQIDPSLSEGLPTDQVNQSAEKGEQATQLLQGQGTLAQPAKQKVSQPQHPHSKINSGQVPLSKKQQIPPNSDSTNQGLASLSVLGPPNLPHQSVPTSVSGSSNHRMLMHPQQQVQLRPKLTPQSQAALQGVLQRKRSLNSEPSNKLQAGELKSEQRNICNTSQIGKTSLQGSNNLTNAAEVSAAGATQMKVAVPSLDSIGTPPINSAASETGTEVNQGVSQMQSSGKLSPIGRNAGVKWKQKSSELHPPSLVNQPQLHQQQQQRPLLQHPDQAQVLQAGNRGLLARPSEPRLD
ncbi:chromatin modification-related protein EAF1 B-like [Solanum pennellii]|uniref:Chromatin modification-related protein EAF1 B-like n=1 Tax=Solanum pennellii TaxID=28526 RepID=A0ABM1H1U6_SOLPN|nr:chromatin modification-related protein EAF1 B-like [Solanum pennellii]XP_015079192.1 chromatin modification-related protein EAF1 B-like [Solanum pennellii]XP_015079194.1 chromatin modification-related protein EAF1 B-like [Solanum pennellii]